MMTGRAETAAPLRRVLPGAQGGLLAFTGREEGNMSLVVGAGAPAAARRDLLGAVGLQAEDGVFMEQVHGAGVAVVGPQDRGRGLTRPATAVPGVDALVSTAPGVGLVVLVADCVPVLLAVPDRGVGAVHAGRNGIASGVVGAAVATLLAETHAAAREVTAFVGPAIGGCCYEVPAEIAVEVAAVVPGVHARTSWGTISLDLPAAVEHQLRAAGVETITAVGSCTRCDADRWFSHRASAASPGGQPAAAGRQAAAIRLGTPAWHRPDPSLHST